MAKTENRLKKQAKIELRLTRSMAKIEFHPRKRNKQKMTKTASRQTEMKVKA